MLSLSALHIMSFNSIFHILPHNIFLLWWSLISVASLFSVVFAMSDYWCLFILVCLPISSLILRRTKHQYNLLTTTHFLFTGGAHTTAHCSSERTLVRSRNAVRERRWYQCGSSCKPIHTHIHMHTHTNIFEDLWIIKNFIIWRKANVSVAS